MRRVAALTQITVSAPILAPVSKLLFTQPAWHFYLQPISIIWILWFLRVGHILFKHLIDLEAGLKLGEVYLELSLSCASQRADLLNQQLFVLLLCY